jgi:hypothetical protein
MLSILLLAPTLIFAEPRAQSLFMHVDDNEDKPLVTKPTAIELETKKKSRNNKHGNIPSASSAQNSYSRKNDITKSVSKAYKRTVNTYKFANNSKTPTTQKNYVGLQYWIDLIEPDGGSKRVTPGHIFHSGDKIKFRIISKSSGYLYIENLGTSGNKHRLYPKNGQESILINPGLTYTVPEDSYIKFDDGAGSEKITIALAKIPIINDISETSATQEHAFSNCKDLFVEDNGIECLRNRYSASSKDLFFEEDTKSIDKPASYSVLPESELDKGKIMFVDFKLNHR